MMAEIITVLIACLSQSDFDEQIKNLPEEAFDIHVVTGGLLDDPAIFMGIYYRISNLGLTD